MSLEGGKPDLKKFMEIHRFAIVPSVPILNQLDSLQLVDLVNRLETFFKVEIASFEVTPENFGTLESLSAFVERKLGK